MNLYSREAAILYLEEHGREVTEEAIAEYFDWWDGWLDTVIGIENFTPIPVSGPCIVIPKAVA